MSHGFVLDASVTLSWFFADEDSAPGRALHARAMTQTVHVPALWITEVGNSLRVAEARQRIRPADTARFLDVTRDWRLAIEPVDVARVIGTTLPLARAHSLTVYDASYLELAQRLALPIATLDREMIAAAAAAGIDLVAA